MRLSPFECRINIASPAVIRMMRAAEERFAEGANGLGAEFIRPAERTSPRVMVLPNQGPMSRHERRKAAALARRSR